MNDDRVDAMTNKYAWLVSSTWAVLHYIPGENSDTWSSWWDNQQDTRTAACGRTFDATLPGWFSRMGAPRCRNCCQHLGITHGDGAPPNDKTVGEVVG